MAKDEIIPEKVNGTGFMRILRAFHCSKNGFISAFKYEAAFRQELLLCTILLPLSFVIASTLIEWAMLIASLLFLLFSEIVNSALEALADRISLEHHELLGRAKDLGSAGVLIAIVIVIIVWCSVAYSYLF